MNLCISVFCHFHSANDWKVLNHDISHDKKNGPTKNPREKVLDPRKTHEKKFCTHEIPTRKKFVPMKYQREKVLDPQNTHEKKI